MHLDYRYCLRGKLDYFRPSFADKIEGLHWAAVKELVETSMLSSFR